MRTIPLIHYLALWAPVGYLTIFLGMIFEGDLVLFTAAFLTRTGAFNPILMIVTVFSGVIIGDLLWYKLGARLNEGSFLQRAASRLGKPFDRHLLARPLHTIFISKFVYGIHHAVLMRAGALGLDKKKFIKDDLISSFWWVTVVGGLGYFSSASFDIVKHYLRSFELFLLVGVLGFILLERLITWQLKKNL